jgi:hypothetical protein
MNKPGSLRAAIAAAVPDLEANPDKFLVFADEGGIAATGTKSLSFEYRYTLNMILMDYAGDADTVMIALLAWVKRNQPELVHNFDKQKDGITFEVDHLNNTTCDLSIKLRLTESVKVTTGPDGTHTAFHLDEPVPEWETTGLGG